MMASASKTFAVRYSAPLALNAAFLLASASAVAEPEAKDAFHPWLIDFADDADTDSIEALDEDLLALAFERVADVEEGMRFTAFTTGDGVDEALETLRHHPLVESVEANQVIGLFDNEMASPAIPTDAEPNRPTRPNDPLYKHQWHFDMVGAEAAWARTAGQGVVVAVLDTGVSPGKIGKKKSRYKRVPDLRKTEFVPGYNFIGRNSDPSDGHAHGTHVAGTIAQSTNNGVGVAGLAYQAKIMPVKVLSDRGWGSVGAIAGGIRWAADNGAHVINMSLGGGGYSKSMDRAVKYARDKGVVVVAAAGNAARQRVEFPAAYPGVVAVSALGPDGKLAFYSSFGKELAIAAPGGDTRVDLNGDGMPDGVVQNTIAIRDPSQHGYFPFQGTSMATPHVAGAVALIISAGVTDPDRVVEVLRSSASDLHDPIRYGSGALRVDAAVKAAQSESSALGLLLAALLSTALIRRNRRRGDGFCGGPLRFAGAAMVGSAGLFFLHGWLPGARVWASPAAEWFAGAGLADTPIVLSVVVPFAFVLLTHQWRALRPVLAGLMVGYAAYLGSHALLGELNVSWIPGHGMLDAAWLWANAAVGVAMANVLSKKDAA